MLQSDNLLFGIGLFYGLPFKNLVLNELGQPRMFP